MHLSIRWRLAVGIVVTFVVTLAVIFITVQLALDRILREDLDEGVSSDFLTINAEMIVAGSLQNRERLEDYVQQHASAREDKEPFLTVIRDVEGNVVVATAGVQPAALALTPEERQRVLEGRRIRETVDLPGDKEYRVLTGRVTLPSGEVAIVQVARVTEPVTEAVNTLLVILIAEGVAATFIVVGAALWLSRGAVRPLQRVIDVAAEIQASDLTRRIGARGQPAEVQKLADTFDSMLARLEKAFNEQQQLLMDVGHELRTPLTVLKGNIDVMLMDPACRGETREQLERMSAEVSRLIRLTGNLLYMAAAEAGREPEKRPVELDVLCLEVLRQGRDLRPDVKVAFGHEDQVSVMGDRDQLKQMLLNLVENAVKYTPSGGKVTISLEQRDSQARIQVADTGPGIPADVLPYIFERFYRGNHKSLRGGTGLGLAIADRIARAHGGRIEVESTEGKGSTFTVTLPLADPGPAEPGA
jgi:signal transduction histidine kinase